MPDVFKKTDWRCYEERGIKYRIRAEYGLSTTNHTYFFITGEIQRFERGNWREDSFGQLHQEIESKFPELAELLPWHLCSEFGLPMHYEENGKYWWDLAVGLSKWDLRSYDPNPVNAFNRTCLIGILESDSQRDFEARPNRPFSEIRKMLADRIPELRDEFLGLRKKHKIGYLTNISP